MRENHIPLAQEEVKLCECSSEIRVLFAMKDLDMRLDDNRIVTSKVMEHNILEDKNDKFVYRGLNKLADKGVLEKDQTGRLYRYKDISEIEEANNVTN